MLNITAACGAPPEPPPPAQQPEPEIVHIAQMPPENPYLPPLEDRQRSWQRRRLTDYVFVFNEHSMFRSASREDLRIVVRNGKVVEARSQLYAGDPKAIEQLPTMDSLFERAKADASFGRDGVAASFSVEYDDSEGTLRSVTADGRLDIADDESYFEVGCFSTQPKGCAPVRLTKPQCRAKGGVVEAASGSFCERGKSVGLIGEAQMCCVAQAD